MRTGASECRIVLAYAPNRDVPLDVVYEMEGRAERLAPSWFSHSAVRQRYPGGAFVSGLGSGAHFTDATQPWNLASLPHGPCALNALAGIERSGRSIVGNCAVTDRTMWG